MCMILKDIPKPEFPINSVEHKIEELLEKFPTVPRKDGKLGMTSFAMHKIELTDETPIAETPRYYPPHLSREIQRQVDDLLKQGLIRPSKSPYGFNPVLQKKPDGHIVSQGGLKMQEEKVRAIRDFPEPTTVNRVLRFHEESIPSIQGCYANKSYVDRDPVEPLSDEPDHLEGNRDIYTPIFALNFCNNFLEKVKLAQNLDNNLLVIRKIVENRPLAKEDLSKLEGIPESRKSDLRWFKKRYLVKDEVLCRFVATFESPDLITSGNDDENEIEVDVHSSNGMAHTPVSTLESHSLVAHTPELLPHTAEILALTPEVEVRTDLVGRRPVPNSFPVGMVAVPVVAKSLIEEVMNVFHDSAEAGHMGVKKTQNSIKRRFFWNGMNKDIHEYVKSCRKCQQFKTDRMKPRGLLGNVPIANAVFETIFIDFIGPYPRSFRRRNTYCLVVVDQLSNWVELFPMTKATGEKVAMCLEDQIFCRYGAPKCIISDNGSNFINKKMKKLCKEWSIRHATISAYHPIPNRSERTNQDLVRMIATFIESTHGKWDENIQKFALVLRSMVNDTTQVSPAILNLGREIALPIDRALKTDVTKWSEEEKVDFARKLPESIRDLISRVKVRIAKVHENNKRYFDLKRREEIFEVGQEVWIRNHAQSDKDSNINQKFLPKWLGPFKILRRNADTYTNDVCSRLIPKRHVSDLKPYFSRPPRSGKVPIPIRKVVTDQEPKIPVVRQLRARTKVDYRKLATIGRTN
ncbi:Transposon Tf2-6 polyprotein [Folsomia candida]|uniref:RNA-directed DNA polymerase n=1 Tax=Folsomia candida TaxID=158441 RepID=A0A226DNV4_FOLCA|nr:Transposon Tf2-6 polyprotein [Folsomia candida]